MAEEEAAGVGVGRSGPCTVEAYGTSAFGVAPIITFDDVDLDRGPNNMTVKAGLPPSGKGTDLWLNFDR